MAAFKCPATQALLKKLNQAASTCTACQPQIEYLESIAGVCPEFAPKVEELRQFFDHISTLTQVGMVGANDNGGAGDQ